MSSMSYGGSPPIIDVHTPFSSFAIVHSLTQESLADLYNKLSRKPKTEYYGKQIGPGWLKYEYSDSIWNLDDASDYTIFAWRRREEEHARSQLQHPESGPIASSSKTSVALPSGHAQLKVHNAPTLHMHDPEMRLPSPMEYCNPSYYVFQVRAKQAEVESQRSGPTTKGKDSPVPSSKTKKGKIVGLEDGSSEDDSTPKFKKQFNRFHEENGVRTVIGSIGSVEHVRMLLKAGYRHVYISRKFAVKHGFLPSDAAPGHYGYGGLVNIGKWPISLVPSISQPEPPSKAGHQRSNTLNNQTTGSSAAPKPASPDKSHTNDEVLTSTRIQKSSAPSILSRTNSARRVKQQALPNGFVNSRDIKLATDSRKVVMMDVYLSEEPHFDVVLGRSFFEKRQVKLSTIDPTDVVCLDTGEKIECELVILKDGKGEIVTVT